MLFDFLSVLTAITVVGLAIGVFRASRRSSHQLFEHVYTVNQSSAKTA